MYSHILVSTHNIVGIDLLYGIRDKMGVINSFVIELSTPVQVGDLEGSIKSKSRRVGIGIKLHHDSPHRDYSGIDNAYGSYSNVLDLYFPALKEAINGVLEYGIEDLSQAVETVTYSGYYSDFIIAIDKIGMDHFEAILQELFEAEKVAFDIR